MVFFLSGSKEQEADVANENEPSSGGSVSAGLQPVPSSGLANATGRAPGVPALPVRAWGLAAPGGTR